MKKIIITGVSGFIGSKLLQSLQPFFENVYGADCCLDVKEENLVVMNLTDFDAIDQVTAKIKPDAVIHCAGIAHQKIDSIDSKEYFRINSLATENLAKAVISSNPNAHFIFLSSIAIYGENHHNGPVSEEASCKPSSDYAESKFDAEKRLKRLYNSGKLKRLDILRLSPVYDSNWSLNLDRRVFAPKRTAYVRFGQGGQMMSAVSRQNVVGFIQYLIENSKSFGERYCNIYNVCDERPYSFSTIIDTFKRSPYHPDRGVVTVPLSLVWGLTRLAGLVLNNKRQWIHSCYDKLAYDLIFDNSRMLATGFKPKQTLESVFNPQITQIYTD